MGESADDAGRKDPKLPVFDGRALGLLEGTLWAFSRGRSEVLDPRDPSFFDRLRASVGERVDRDRYRNNDWRGLYLGLFAALPDYRSRSRLWISLRRSERGLIAEKVVVDRGDNSGPVYDLAGFTSAFASDKDPPSPYIHLPGRVLEKLWPGHELYPEIWILPFLGFTPGAAVERFNAAAYARPSVDRFVPIGLFSFLRDGS